jgi:hypothetical protein
MTRITCPRASLVMPAEHVEQTTSSPRSRSARRHVSGGAAPTFIRAVACLIAGPPRPIVPKASHGNVRVCTSRSVRPRSRAAGGAPECSAGEVLVPMVEPSMDRRLGMPPTPPGSSPSLFARGALLRHRIVAAGGSSTSLDIANLSN